MGLIAKTQILLSNGSIKNIEDISIGDEVISHNNISKKVINKYKNYYSGDLISFSIANSVPIITKNQLYKIYLNSKDTLIWRAINSNKYYYDFGEAKNGDLVLAPIIKTYIKSNITDNQARLLGLFAAEGSFHKKEIIFSFGAHEEKTLAVLTKELLYKEFSLKSKIFLKDSKATVCAYNGDISDFFRKHVGCLSHKKILSKEIVFGDINTKINFLIGWLEGDGSVDKYSGKIIGTTVSINMANQIKLMLNGLKINNSFYNTGISKPSMLKNGRLIVGKNDAYRIKIPYNEGGIFINNSDKLSNKFIKKVNNIKMNRFIDNYRTHKILNKNIINYSGELFYLDIEDDKSFVANGIICKQNMAL